MDGIRVLREAHEQLALRLMNQRPRDGRGFNRQSFWAQNRSQAMALPSWDAVALEVPGTTDLQFVLDASFLDLGDVLG